MPVDSGALRVAAAAGADLVGPVHHGRPGVRLFWSRGPELRTYDLPALGAEYAIIGRHSSCDFVLEGDEAVSLRHLLARAVVLDDGAVALRLLDLRAALPFYLEDGEARRSLLCAGPVALQLGSYVLGALPYEAGGGPEGSPCRTHVSVLPPPPELASGYRAPPARALRTAVARAGVVVELERRAWRAAVELADDALDAGILVGRAERCTAPLRPVLHGGVSRAHLLLLRERDELYAYDLCSLQGTYVDGRRARRCRLSEGSELQMASRDPVTLRVLSAGP
jgi:hypothetical protein